MKNKNPGGHGQLDGDVGAGNHVHLRLAEPAQDFLHQDGRRLANFQSDDSILWGDKEVLLGF